MEVIECICSWKIFGAFVESLFSNCVARTRTYQDDVMVSSNTSYIQEEGGENRYHGNESQSTAADGEQLTGFL